MARWRRRIEKVAKKAKGEGQSLFIVNVSLAVISRRYLVFSFGIIIDVHALFFRNDSDYAFFRDRCDVLFRALDTFYDLVGNFAVGAFFHCGNCGSFVRL